MDNDNTLSESISTETDKLKEQIVTDIAMDPTKAVAAKISEKIITQINSDQNTQEKIADVADKIIDHGINTNTLKAEAAEHRAASEAKDTDFTNNASEYLHHGIDHKVQPWQSKLMIVMNNIWFVIISVLFFFTFIPFSMFMSRVKALSGILKFVAITIGVLCLLLILFGLTTWILRKCGINLW